MIQRRSSRIPAGSMEINMDDGWVSLHEICLDPDAMNSSSLEGVLREYARKHWLYAAQFKFSHGWDRKSPEMPTDVAFTFMNDLHRYRVCRNQAQAFLNRMGRT